MHWIQLIAVIAFCEVTGLKSGLRINTFLCKFHSLVNNVGTHYGIPSFFLDVPEQVRVLHVAVNTLASFEGSILIWFS